MSQKVDEGMISIVDHWITEMQDAEVATVLHLDRGPAGDPDAYRMLSRTFENASSNRFRQLCGMRGVQVSTVLYTAWAVLLQRYLRTEEVRFAAVAPEEDRIVLVRIAGEASLPFESLVAQAEDMLAQRKAYALTRSELRDLSGSDSLLLPFNTAVAVEAPGAVLGLPVIPGCDLTIRFVLSDVFAVRAEFKPDAFQPTTIRRLLGHVENIVLTWIESPHMPVGRIALLSQDEREQLLVGFNPTDEPFSSDATIHRLFAEQTRRTPDRPAIVDGKDCLTYRQLDEQSNRMARVLIELGVQEANTFVAVMMRPTLSMFAGILAVLKAGAAYVPIDPNYPPERIRYILEDSGAKLLLTEGESALPFAYEGQVVDLADRRMHDGDASPLPEFAEPSGLAYVIYTSGSTGQPKGTLIEHRSLVHFCEWHCSYFGVTMEDRSSKYCSVGFDASILETFPYLISGAAVHIIPEHIRLDAAELNGYFNRHGITISFLPTQLGEQFMKLPNRSLRVLMTGGEKLKTFHPQSYLIYNVYGPTENTIITTTQLVAAHSDNIPIGKPLNNVRLYILDACGEPQPVGVPGELCISGIGLARGYLNWPQLTEEKFVAHPFREGERLYRTGDLARWLPDGSIEYVGRLDHQVKIRGFRVETGEIEQRLRLHDRVLDCIVIAREDDAGRAYLCAYVVSEEPLTRSELSAFLAEQLPNYMVPSWFVMLSRLPINANGKVDRRALPEPEREAESASYAPPASEAEQGLAELWKELLGLRTVGVHDRFFDAGGHSLHVAVLRGKIERRFGVRLSIAELFEHATIREQAERIGQAGKPAGGGQAIEKAPEREHYPLHPAQKRLFFIGQMEQVGTAYNTPMLLKIEGSVDRRRMERTFEQMIERHESLRTAFAWVDGELAQTIWPRATFQMQFHAAAEEEAERLMSAFVVPFDLGKSLLFRAGLISCSEELHYLMLDFHHIIVDGVSMHVFFEEWSRLYRGEELPRPTIQFKDYAFWLNGRKPEEEAQQREYWLAALSGELPILQLPTDKERPGFQSFRGDTYPLRLDAGLTVRLKQFALRTDTTLYMILLAAYNVLLARYSGQEDIIVGVPVASRPQTELQPLIGMFVNTMPVRSFPERTKTFANYLQELKSILLAAFEHQDYDLERMMQSLRIPRVPERSPLFDTIFVMQNTGRTTTPSIDGSRITVQRYVDPISKYDLILDAKEMEETLRIDFQYCTDLFVRDTIERMANQYVRILEDALASEEKRLSELRLLSEAEIKEQVEGRNQTESAYDRELTIHGWFEEQARQTPDRPAVVFGDEALTYRQLNDRANRLAAVLIRHGVRPEQLVGLMTERSPDMIVGLLGILKAGGAYLPIDPDYPADRIKYMLDNSRARLLLTHTHLADRVEFDGMKLCLDTNAAYEEAADNPPPRSRPSDLLYVIYTSGTTGKPKGVMIEHRNMVNLLHHQFRHTSVDYSRSVLQFTTLSFDVSSQEIWSALLAGGALHLVTNETRRSPDKLLRLIEERQIQVLFLPVSYLKLILNESAYADKLPASVRHIITAGEPLAVPDKFKTHLQRHQVFLHNHYGPSETHVATAHTIDPNGPIPELPPIGKPIANTRIYLLNDRLHVQPPGVPGELYIAGDGVGRGYFNDERLTAEKFVPDPFVGEGRMYKTGDLARWTPEGALEFLGRLDHQVKIRGFRIELGEIENALLNHPSIREAVVIAREDGSGGKELCAYFAGTEKLPVKVVKEHLSKALPEYMLPSYFVPLKNMPLTPNGKIDRRALPEPAPGERAAAGRDRVVPRTDIERKIAAVWGELLSVPDIGVHDNFFELGGHSLKAAAMTARLQQDLDIGVNDVFEHQTIASLSAKVKPKANYLTAKLEQLKTARRDDAMERFDEETVAYRARNERYAQLDLTRDSGGYSDILLTGATGYLGIHLLRELLAGTAATVLVLVRAATEAEARERLLAKLAFYFAGDAVEAQFDRRIRIYRGDLSQDSLGLDEETYLELARTVDCIVHSAATVKHYGSYSHFESHNIASTERLLAFARMHRTKDVHHMSTLGVATGHIPGQSAAYFTEYDLDRGQQYENYYTKSKFEAEKRVVQARAQGLGTSIYRIGNLVFQSDTGKFQQNIEENAFYATLKSFIRLGMVPRLEADIDFSCVDRVSQAIVLLMKPAALKDEIFHLYNPHYESMHRVLGNGRSGGRMATGTLDEFIDYMKNRYEEGFCREEIESLMLHYGWLEQQEQTRFTLASEKTILLLKKLGFEWQAISDKQMDDMLRYCREVGFI
ncbi:amino acid adenylation domain-containing protein [Paenibacillus sp. MZ04-78.2]|uniref:non-ribosomal peptide synthetase n=1 Tax=Paenibacillus sp. MZ04-78.2 TaxID=2962034 RepID=UPI0020B8B1E8|nr:non-ribosomal peptide synthetase [Paenibacillus sp. MZ04-78.2]MCP3773384.1 amino acid adenylation domain-containing protein [Paenibacillus sp. MZ04-78.2]